MPRRPKVNTLSKPSIEGELSAIAKTLKARRTELGWTQAQLAEKMDCEITTIQAYEQKRRKPSLPTLLMLCKLMRLKLTIS
jgi:transcriptional regulator with XRE-family HTH domain